MWCIPNPLDKKYIENMEDVLNIYAKPYNPKEPVLVFDEKSVTLHDEKQPPQLQAPGRVLRRDSHCIRKGTANVFCSVEPLSGKFLFSVSKKRGARDYAKCIHRISRRYPEAKKIHLIQDNLNTHSEKSLVKT